MAIKKVFGQEEGPIGGGSVIGGGNTGTGGTGAAGTNWTNLQSYLTANKGQGAGMAQDVTKGTQDEIDRIEGDNGSVAAWKQTATQEVDKGTKQDNYSQTFSQGTAKDIAGVNKDAYAAWRELPAYSGPNQAQGTQGYGQVYNDVEKTKSTVKNLDSYDGQKAALQNTYGQGGNYGKSYAALDAFLMRGDDAGKQQLQNFQTQNANFGQKFDTAKGDVDKSIGNARVTGQANHDRTMTAAGDRQKQYQLTGTQRMQADTDASRNAASNAIANKYREAGLEAPMQVDPYMKAREGSNQAYLDDIEYAALNSLAGMDDDDSTVAQSRGSKSGYDIDWNGVQGGIDKAKVDSAAVQGFKDSGGIRGYMEPPRLDPPRPASYTPAYQETNTVEDGKEYMNLLAFLKGK